MREATSYGAQSQFGEADEDASVTFYAVNRQELVLTTLSGNICFMCASLRLHILASHLLLDPLTSATKRWTHAAAFYLNF